MIVNPNKLQAIILQLSENGAARNQMRVNPYKFQAMILQKQLSLKLKKQKLNQLN